LAILDILMQGKTILVWTVGTIATFLIVTGYFVGYEHLWAIWKIPPMSMSFSDLRNLTGGAESLALGYDPLYYNPQDPWNRPLNQPRLVQYILKFTHVNQGHTVLLGIVFGLLFLTGVFIAFRKLDKLSAIIISFLIFSPVAVLGVERGNHDLLIFFLVALALFLADRAWISMPVLLLASFIKLFPVFAVLYLWRYPTKKSIVISSAFLLIFISYMIYNLPDLPQVFSSTQKGVYHWAYGVMTYDKMATGYSYIPVAAVLISTTMFYINNIRLQGWQEANSHYIDAFRAGAGVYLGTFLLGNSWAYRLIFLIFIIPQLVTWIKTDRSRKLISVVALVSTIASCCPTWIDSGILDEILNWLLFSCLLYLMLSSLPPFFQRLMLISKIQS
jgi:hypothetical protein